jgi:hypothetical protein
MGQVNITITVDTELLKSLSTGPDNINGEPPEGNNTWCTIAQEGGIAIPEDTSQLTDPSLLITKVHLRDYVTFYGNAKTVTEGELQPVINITQIDFVDCPVGSFSDPVVKFPDQNGILSGSTITVQALKEFDDPSFTVKANDSDTTTSVPPQTYMIHFSISYKGRILDPKIKITHPLK